jgi:hypothetical protein
MDRTQNVDPPRQVEVLHDGRWLRGWLRAYMPDDNGGWRGLVDYRDPVSLGHWLQWRDGRELRRPEHTGVRDMRAWRWPAALRNWGHPPP